MIHEVDDALRALIRRDAIDGAGVEVVFDAPTKDWATRRNTPTLDVYLYDIREDPKRRQVGLREDRTSEGIVTSRRPLPRYYRLSYLVTAWTQRPEDEHRLLSSVLACFVRFDQLPDDVLTGSLAGIGLAVGVFVALPPPEDRQISDVWSALGGELKPALDLVVVAPVDTGRLLPFGPPVLEAPRLTIGGGEIDQETVSARASGRARNGDGAGGGPDEGAAAAGLAGAGPATVSGPGGRRMSGGRPGRRAPGAAASAGTGGRAPSGPRGGRAAAEGAGAGAGGGGDEAPVPVEPPEEEVRSGADHQPGRVFRIRGTPQR